MKQQLLLLSLLLSAGASAQSLERQVIGSAGGSFSGSTFSADYTTGETVTATVSAGSFILSQGFQQPEQPLVSIRESQVDVSYRLYPNPASSNITLELNSGAPATLELFITSAAGQTVYRSTEELSVSGSHTQTISLNALASGVYFLNLSDSRGKLVQSIKFEKH